MPGTGLGREDGWASYICKVNGSVRVGKDIQWKNFILPSWEHTVGLVTLLCKVQQDYTDLSTVILILH